MKKYTKKLISVLMSACLICTSAAICTPVGASTAKAVTKSQEQRKEELEKKLEETNKKLKKLGKEKQDTQEYLNVIDTKLDTLKEQYSITLNDVNQTENRVNQTEKNIQTNTKTLADIESDLKTMTANTQQLETDYMEVQQKYCQRMRAIYISGETESVLSFLLSANGIENFLTRLEMVAAVSRKDGKLMQDVNAKITELQESQKRLNKKQEELNKTQKVLKSDTESLKIQQVSLNQKEAEMKKKKTAMEKQQTEANTVLQQINDKTKEYSELHDMTQEEIDQIDSDIQAAIKKYQNKQTTTKKATTKKHTTTKKPTTTKHNTTKHNTTKKNEKTTKVTTTEKETEEATEDIDSEFINMTYPCPDYTRITCAYGAYRGHTGCDFSTGGTTGHKIVAADSGTVIISKDITCNRSRCKKSYHGGGYCSYGRYIVIMHDKPNKNGETVYTLYAHNSVRSVSAGQHVSKGQQIALSGSTGNSTGPHLHFEVRLGDGSYSSCTNPAHYLP